jgi:hypothetical protein
MVELTIFSGEEDVSEGKGLTGSWAIFCAIMRRSGVRSPWRDAPQLMHSPGESILANLQVGHVIVGMAAAPLFIRLAYDTPVQKLTLALVQLHCFIHNGGRTTCYSITCYHSTLIRA